MALHGASTVVHLDHRLIAHLHVHIDDLPWGWVEANDVNTISVAGLHTRSAQDACRVGRRSTPRIHRVLGV